MELYAIIGIVLSFVIGAIGARYNMSKKLQVISDYAWGLEHLLVSINKVVVDFRKATQDGNLDAKEIEGIINDLEDIYNKMVMAKEQWENQ
jgi:hypothetical protein